MEGLRESISHLPSDSIFRSIVSPSSSAYEASSEPVAPAAQKMDLLIGGYSYGALITIHLPSLDVIIRRFQHAVKGTAEAEIRLRAISLTAQWTKDARLYNEMQQARRAGSHEKIRSSPRTLAVIMGGDESEPGSRRPSHESRRSLDVVRRSVERGSRKIGLKRHYDGLSEGIMIERCPTSTIVPVPRVFYLVISPPLLVTSLLTMFSSSVKMNTPYSEEKICSSPTLAIYGDRDSFTSQKRYRRWAEGLAARSESRFQFHEVEGAGHFYREDGAETEMRICIQDWIHDIYQVTLVA